jgi:hypothetical protein
LPELGLKNDVAMVAEIEAMHGLPLIKIDLVTAAVNNKTNAESLISLKP